MNRALILDRDGTIIEDRGYMHDPALVQLVPGAAETLRAMQREGWTLIVISNQSGVGRGLITPAEMDAVQNRFLEVVQLAGVRIAACYFCPHRPDEGCQCRKPSVFHVEQAAREFDLDLSRSWMIGDRRSDILCGRQAGCRTIWFSNPLFPVVDGLADFVASDWHQVQKILRGERSQGKSRPEFGGGE
jgi:histidinol-phosphate phosphatase family protein